MKYSRRRFIQGIGGATLTLPWFESLNGASVVKPMPQRMAHFYVPIGVVRRGFFPGESDHVIPKGNLGNVMASLGKQDPHFSVKPLEELTPTMRPLDSIKNTLASVRESASVAIPHTCVTMKEQHLRKHASQLR